MSFRTQHRAATGCRVLMASLIAFCISTPLSGADSFCSTLPRYPDSVVASAYLRKPRGELEAACVEKALFSLELPRNRFAIPLAISYLDFPAPRPLVITGPYIPMVFETDGTWYPAANALLADSGYVARPDIKRTLIFDGDREAVSQPKLLGNAAQVLFWMELRDDPVSALQFIVKAA